MKKKILGIFLSVFAFVLVPNIVKAEGTVVKPTTDMCSGAVYTGEEQSLTSAALTGYHWVNNMETDAGTYTVTAVLDEGYEWDDNSSSNIDISCSIARAKLTLPTLDEDEYVFSGSSIYPVFIGFDDTKMDMSGNLYASLPSEYVTNISPKLNYEWQDGSITAEAYTWHIIKGTPTTPVVTSYEGTFDGQPHTVTVSGIDSLIALYSTDQSSWDTTIPTLTNIGSITVYVKTQSNSVFNESAVASGTVTILQGDPNDNGWYDDGTYKYYYVDGSPVTGLRHLPRLGSSDPNEYTYYYFSEETESLGRMVTDSWIETNNSKYYFDNDGAAVTGWYQEVSTTDFYYFGSDCKMVMGLQYLPNKDDNTVSNYYYFDGLGSNTPGLMVTNTWIALPEGTFYMTSDGTPKTGWYDDGSAVYYFDNDGILTTGLFTDTDDRTYYFSEESENIGHMLTGLQVVGDNVYYFADDDDNANNIKKGEAITGWKTVNGYKYYFRTATDTPTVGAKGTGVTGFVELDSENYYFRATHEDLSSGPLGSMFKGFAVINNEKYYFRITEDEISTGSEGSMLKSACVTVDNGYYCFDENGDLESQIISIAKPTDSRCNLGLVYDGTNKNLISDASLDVGFTWSNYTEVNAGEYTIIATLNDDYKWDDDSTDPVGIVCSIAKQQLTIPTMAVSDFDYSGYLITPILANFNNYVMNIEGNESAIEAGEYASTVSLKFPSNYEWADGTDTPIEFSWKIEKINYAAPIVEPYLGTYDGEEHSVTATGDGTLEYSTDNILWSTDEIKYSDASDSPYPVYVRVKADNNHNASQSVESSITINKIVVNFPVLVTSLFNYTGEDINPELTGVDMNYMTVSGETIGKNAGEYDIMVSLKDRTNTVWEDNTDGSHFLKWKIAKVTGGAPTVGPYVGTYDKQPHSIEAIGSGELEYSLDITDENGWSDENPTKVDAGVYTIYVRTKGDENHEPSESVSSTITINKRSLIKPTKTKSSYLFTGSEVDFSVNFFNDNWSEWMMKTGTYSATTVGEYVAEVALLDSVNTEWADGTTANVSFTWYITQSQAANPVITNYTGAYDGQPHSITVENPSYGTIFYSTNYNTPGVDTVWSTTNPTRTNVGYTNVYVYIKGDSNHTDSQVVMGTITITDAVPDYNIDNYTVDENNDFITGITVGTELETFISNITLGTGYSVVVDTKTVDGKQILYTGGKTTIKQGNAVVAVFTNVVSGDSSGDGKVNYLDYVYVYNHIQKTKHPESNKQLLVGAYLKAGDMSNDNNITYLDYVFIYNKIKELKGGNN